AVDMIVGPPLHRQIAFGRTPDDVAGAVEAVLGEGTGVGRRIVVVGANRIGAARQQVARLALRYGIALVVHDQHLVVGADGPALRVDDDVVRIVEARVVDQPFGHAEHLLQLHAQHGLDPSRDFGRQLGAADLYDFQAGDIVRRLAGRGLQPYQQ